MGTERAHSVISAGARATAQSRPNWMGRDNARSTQTACVLGTNGRVPTYPGFHRWIPEKSELPMNLRTAIGCVCSALVLLVGVQVVSAAPPPDVSWATKAGGTGADYGQGISALPDGSSIVTGYFSGTATFGSTTLTSDGSNDVFTARYLEAPQAPAAPVAVAGSASAAVTITPLAGGSVTSYTVTSDPGERTCTVVAPATSCTVEGLTNGTSYRFRATATNASGTGVASAWSNAVTPAATPTAATPTAAMVIKGKVHCVATTCVTTGSVPAGATRITQRATTRPSGRSATGKCTIRRTKAKRTYSCTVHLTRGTWVITTTARTQSVATAHFSKRVRVAPRKVLGRRHGGAGSGAR